MNAHHFKFADAPEAREKIREVLDRPIEERKRPILPSVASEQRRPWAIKPVSKRSVASVATLRDTHDPAKRPAWENH